MKRRDSEYIAILTVALVIAFSARLAWAQLVYGDLKCAVAECRIVK